MISSISKRWLVSLAFQSQRFAGNAVHQIRIHLRHWLCTAAVVSMLGLSPINVPV